MLGSKYTHDTIFYFHSDAMISLCYNLTLAMIKSKT